MRTTPPTAIATQVTWSTSMRSGPRRIDLHKSTSPWARDFWSALTPFDPLGVYVNFLGDEGEERVRAAYGQDKFRRLVKLKDKYDPINVFRVNQNITPSAGENGPGSPEGR